MFYFYIARCSDGTLYCGATRDIESREKIHNSGKGAKYTRARLPVSIIYSESYATLKATLGREAEVKKWKKKRKEDLIRRK